MHLRSDWKSRLLTVSLLILGGLATALLCDASLGYGKLPLWTLLSATIVYIYAFHATKSLSERISNPAGYLLDLLLSIPLGVVFYLTESIHMPANGLLRGIIHGFFIAFFVTFLAAYYYRRHPRGDAG